jgi:cation diffusion facilitator family transporter
LDRSLIRYALVAVVAALTTIALKTTAYAMTGSVAILSDAFESLVNLVTSITAVVVLGIAARPADEEHAYGHSKAEYFASGFEGALILFASGIIGFTAVRRLLDLTPLESVGEGLAITLLATTVNFLAGRFLLGVGRRHHSIALEAGGHHLMVDVWTSMAVVAGVAVTAVTGWSWLDPLIGVAVALHIVRTGMHLVSRSMLGLLDTALPEETRQEILGILEEQRSDGIQYHAVRTRQAGAWHFISFHVLVPGEWSVQRGHDLLERIEERIRLAVPNSTVFTHLEPLEDPVSWEDVELRRRKPE